MPRALVVVMLALAAACGAKEPSCDQLIAHEQKVVLASGDDVAPPTVKDQAKDTARRVSTCESMRFNSTDRACYMKAATMEAMRACSGGQPLYPGGLFIFN